MSFKYAKDKFPMKNPDKYVGHKHPIYRSSWEWHFMKMCDDHPSITHWGSENIRIPYIDPLTNKNTHYFPDFFIVYEDKHGNKQAEVVEIKPKNQMIQEFVGKNVYNQAQFVKNKAKWAAATAWCKQNGLRFRVINEDDIFHTGRNKK
jgi:hypothetical protein